MIGNVVKDWGKARESEDEKAVNEAKVELANAKEDIHVFEECWSSDWELMYSTV